MTPPDAEARPPEPWVRVLSGEGATARQAEILAHAGLAPLPLSDLVAAAGTTRATVGGCTSGVWWPSRPCRPAPRTDVRVELTAAQEEAVAGCVELLEAGGGDVLVHGVTGSGKTEVYLRLIEHALELGRGAIVLVPEIALTPQVASRFTARFGATVAVLHSGLSRGRRGSEHRRIAAREARVVVGARSAVFAAVPTSASSSSTRSTMPRTSTRPTRGTTPAGSRPSGPGSRARSPSTGARRRGRRSGTGWHVG